MSEDKEILVRERLETALEALERIPRRFAKISAPDDFYSSEIGVDMLDSICMVLMACGEEFKKVDYQTEGKLFALYDQVPWKDAIGLRNVLAHAYFRANPHDIFSICQNDVPKLIQVLKTIIEDLRNGLSV